MFLFMRSELAAGRSMHGSAGDGRREGICGKMRLHLNSGQACAVKVRHGLSEDPLVRLKSPRIPIGYPSDTHRIPKGSTPEQSRSNPGATREHHALRKAVFRDAQAGFAPADA